ncbi:hypothetical protein [Microbacterium radiodurans]|uniref:Lactococcin 972 family bacteriocin n=1 Tax=Microbacterium radiodurans TaxID=661398 RepID=A0A5J5IP61_9MICO|nr:hypothetical protein [Microbacterium radiodurans]KAA9083742.1 hypothetical protein F6B42_14415 [Microbacterium radiodurans]
MTKTLKARLAPRKAALAVLATLILAGGTFGAAAPAQAAEWKVESTRSYCYGGSWGQQCYKETTWKRTSGFCAKPAGSLTGGLLAWYSYCYKTTTTRTK